MNATIIIATWVAIAGISFFLGCLRGALNAKCVECRLWHETKKSNADIEGDS